VSATTKVNDHAPVISAPRRPPPAAPWTHHAPPALSGEECIAAGLAELRNQLDQARPRIIGFPSATDLDLTALWPFLNELLNNVGDPYSGSAFPANTKPIEREVVEWFADLLHAPADDRWGYVTTGGTEGTEFALLQARTHYPDGIVYYAHPAGHYSIPKLAAKLRMPAVAVRSRPDGAMDRRDLRRQLCARRAQPAIVVATIGSTMTEAVDDVREIRRILDQVPIPRGYIHADAALSGIPLALQPSATRPGIDLADGADSVSISGHKFFGAPTPCGVVLTRRSLKDRLTNPLDMLGTHDATIGGSRSGHAPLVLWYAIHLHGLAGLRRRARTARDLAQYTVDTLTDIGWPAWRHPHAMTAVLDAPPAAILNTWAMPVVNGSSHVITLPRLSREHIDAFVGELAASGSVSTINRAASVMRADPSQDGDPGHDE
jgi:histidine decarboxylase